MFSMAISTHCIYIDRQDTNLKNSRFTEANKHNEEYLGVLDINISSIVVEVIRKVLFFYERYFNYKPHKQNHLTNI